MKAFFYGAAFVAFTVICLTAFPGCSDDNKPPPVPDGGIDGGTDGGGVTDGGIDGGLDGGTDGGIKRHTQFGSMTSGGERIKSQNYRLDLFVAPGEPAGSGSSVNYKLKLGPGGVMATEGR